MQTSNKPWHPPVGHLDTARHLGKKHSPWTVTAALWLLVLMPLLSNAEPVNPNEMKAGGLLLKMQDGYHAATTLNTDVDITVNGLVMRVKVRQQFRNTGTEWAEGIYVFPLPDEAAVDHMRLKVGERIIEGEIQEKEKARKAYEKAKAEGKKTTLVEQQRANLFTTAVANIAPGEAVTVEIEYLEEARYDAGTFSFRFPMTLTPRYMPGSPLADRKGSGWSADTTEVIDASLISPPMVQRSNEHRVSLDVFVNAGVPLDIIASRYHPVSIREEAGRYSVSLDDPDTRLDHDFELVWRPLADSKPRAMSFSEIIDGESYYLLMLVPPVEGRVAPLRMPRETIFIIDTSGSMHGTSINQAKNALGRALQRLLPGDRFNIIEFNSVMRPLFNDSVDASTANLSHAQTFVARLQANGGTEMKPALKFALSSPVTETHLKQVIFITDGSVGNEDALYRVIEQQLGATRLFTVGIGSAPNSWFMRKSAELGRGTFTIISAMHEVGEKMDRLFAKLEAPQVTDIQIDWPAGVDAYPSRVPDLYLGEPVSVRVRADAPFPMGESINIAGNMPGERWTTEIPVTDDHSAFGVGALWARARIAELSDAARRGANPDEIRASIVETAMTHHIVSKYTSLVAVDKTPVRPAGAPLSKDQVPNLMPHGQSANAIFGFPATATPAAALRLQAAVFLLLAALTFLIQRRRRASLA
ncbi:MAG: marine proteobacterial sortase target protein [Woeseiaceae bacterium]|nr:marine proteobacterial sortase target protein [Woeseiaceae bacterium]